MNARRPSFVVLLFCCTVLLPRFCSGGVRCLGGVTGVLNKPFAPKECINSPYYCRKTLCKSGDKEWNTWGCGRDNDNRACEKRHSDWAKRNLSGEWDCVCAHGEKYEDMAFTLPTTPAQLTTVTTTTNKTTKAPKPTTSIPKNSKGHCLVAEIPLALGLPMLLGILPFFHVMFAMLYGQHIN